MTVYETENDITLENTAAKDTYLTAIFTEHGDFIYNVVYRIVGNHADTEEVVQDVFIVVLQKIEEFRYDASLKTWLYRIAVNKALNYLRSKKHEQGLKEMLLNEGRLETEENGLDSRINGEHNNYLIAQLMELLNPDQKVCIILRDIEGLSYEAIADILQININTVKSRLKRARQKMMDNSKGIKGHEM
jgi:RNA polymerase sigma-70 factor, ECF subfamily